VLRHEIEHVLQRHGMGVENEIVDVDLDADTTLFSGEERIANLAAADFCAPTERLNNFLLRKKPFYYEKDVIAFARIVERHPGIVIGQIHRKLDRYDYLRRHLAKIRQFLLPGSIADGWGQSVSVSL